MIDIFIAYSHEDISYKNDLKKFLQPVLREGRINIWDDYDIEAGQEWDLKIKEKIYSADIILLLVSSDSLASDYFYGQEVKFSLERHEKGEAVVVPVVLRHCDWENTPLGGLEALPEKGKPLLEWPTRDQAWKDVVIKLRRVVEKIEDRRKNEAETANAFRSYEAALLAAQQFFTGDRWAEAEAGFTTALGLHRPGFSPEKNTLEKKIEVCQHELKKELERQSFKIREADFARLLTAGESLFNTLDWQNAAKAYSEALKLWEAGFSESEEYIKNRIAACDIEIEKARKSAAAAQLAEQQYNLYIHTAKLNLHPRNPETASAYAKAALDLRPESDEAKRILKESEAALKESLHNNLIDQDQHHKRLMTIMGVAIAVLLGLCIFLLIKSYKEHQQLETEQNNGYTKDSLINNLKTKYNDLVQQLPTKETFNLLPDTLTTIKLDRFSYKVKPGSEIRLKFQNTGKAPLVIRDLISSCDGIGFKAFPLPKTVPIGKIGEIILFNKGFECPANNSIQIIANTSPTITIVNIKYIQ